MDFAFSAEQEQLREIVHDYLSNEAPPSYARAMMDDPGGFTDKGWDAIAALGWPGLAVPEEHGGSGLGYLDLVILAEELGMVVYPGPFLSTVGLAIPAILATADAVQRDALLPELAGGAKRATAAIAEESGAWAADVLTVEASPAADGFALDGTKLFVPDARSADTIIVAARIGDDVAFFALPRDDAGLRIEPMTTVDTTRKLDVVILDGARAADDQLLGRKPHPAATFDAVIDQAKTVLAAEMCGCAAAALELSVEYVKVREQFGRSIASFQAIQHKLADMKVLLENARSLVYYAAWAIDTQASDRRLAAAMAKAFASEACPRVAAEAIQVHGGIAFTWEHDLHMFYKRLKASEVTYGDATENRALVASLLEL